MQIKLVPFPSFEMIEHGHQNVLLAAPDGDEVQVVGDIAAADEADGIRAFDEGSDANQLAGFPDGDQ